MTVAAPAALLSRLGVFVDETFLDEATTERVLAEMRQARRGAATVYGSGRRRVRRGTRSTKRADIADETKELVERRLEEVRPQLEARLGLPLGAAQAPEFLVYEEGDYFRAHRDTAREGDEAPEYIGRRKVSAVVFLNRRTDAPEPEAYGGGALVLYGLLPSPDGEERGAIAPAQPGTLVAFRSEVVHEVRPVEHGERFTIVSWFE
jgi:predicted 2-oxoglutarate/Fe(II)-dependent dioxygenase YbiX